MVERLVRAYVIELGAKPVKAALLATERAGCGARGFLFEGPVHPFVPSVLFGMSELNELPMDADLRNHDPTRTWDDGYADQ